MLASGKCACGCGLLLKPGSKRPYKRGHKPQGATRSAVTLRQNLAKQMPGNNLLFVPADAELCDKVWVRLELHEKVAALNSVYARTEAQRNSGRDKW